MKKYTIAFDCDGTLIRDGAMDTHQIIPREHIRSILIYYASMKFVNVQQPDGTHERHEIKIWVWSGGGETWARQVGRELGIDHYVDRYLSKNLIGKDEQGHPIFDPYEQPDMLFDDIHACVLGKVNFIVNDERRK